MTLWGKKCNSHHEGWSQDDELLEINKKIIQQCDKKWEGSEEKIQMVLNHRGKKKSCHGKCKLKWHWNVSFHQFDDVNGGRPCYHWASQVALMVKEPSCPCRKRVGSLGREDPLEKRMPAHSSILAGRIPRAEEPGRPIVYRVTRSWTQLKQFSTLWHAK